VRRLLVQESVVAEFTRRFVALAKSYVCGHPADEATLVGTVIDERAAIALEAAVHDALKRGAVLLLGGQRRGAVIDPTILAGVSRESALATRECFGPIAPIIPVRDLDDAIECANSTPYGLSSSIVTRSLESAIKAVKGIQAGTVNVNEIPGFRLELTPFGGIKNSGVGIKEGVLEAIKIMTNVKTYSLPW
jgi:aldehyde dehydrogenase (NAD+)